LKLDTLVMIQTKFGFHWSSTFRGEDFWKGLRRTTDDGRQVMAIAHMTLWVRWAKKQCCINQNLNIIQLNLPVQFVLKGILSLVLSSRKFHMHWTSIKRSLFLCPKDDLLIQVLLYIFLKSLGHIWETFAQFNFINNFQIKVSY
jgi:hypothetical protein